MIHDLIPMIPIVSSMKLIGVEYLNCNLKNVTIQKWILQFTILCIRFTWRHKCWFKNLDIFGTVYCHERIHSLVNWLHMFLIIILVVIVLILWMDNEHLLFLSFLTFLKSFALKNKKIYDKQWFMIWFDSTPRTSCDVLPIFIILSVVLCYPLPWNTSHPLLLNIPPLAVDLASKSIHCASLEGLLLLNSTLFANPTMRVWN